MRFGRLAMGLGGGANAVGETGPRPRDLTLDDYSILENSGEDTEVGLFVGVLYPSGSSLIYQSDVVVADQPDSFFWVENDGPLVTLRCSSAPIDYETTPTIDITVRETVYLQADNSVVTFHDTDLTIIVTNVVDETAPTITSNANISVAENAQLAHALTANESVTWALVGGADVARLEVSGSTLRWIGNGTKDFEAPNDFNTNNVYEVIVQATDPTGNVSTQDMTVTVTNVAENLYPDPGLTGNYSVFGGGAHTSGQHTFIAATNSGLVSTSGQTNTDLVAVTAAATLYDISVNLSGYVGGNLWVRMWQGAYVQLIPSANGIATALVTSGATNTVAFNFRGETGNAATVNVTPASGVAVTITLH